MGDTIGIILAVLLLVVGAIGTVAPVIPGVPLSWGGLLLLKFLPSTQDEISWVAIVLLGILTVGVTLLDNILPVWGTKKMGGNKKVVWGATIGLLVGFFLGPWGIILGPFVGALAGGILSGTKFFHAVKHATGAFLGYITGLVLKLITVGLIAFFFLRILL
ncbi:DUF456 domain-containing protein [Dysgonomonadaceae bacterium zrk40]|jgi:uncharacterized protein YqgC (DUF456 family)|nr:DUF456 domain-containing protein [Dysgonomonadaceae bacterium zrk40]